MISNLDFSNLKRKRVLVYGKGITGKFAFKLFKKAKAKVFFFHDGEKQKFKCEKIDLVVLSPGVPRQTELCQQFEQIGVPIVSELEAASAFVEGKLIAITGTNGKTTTCLLLAKMLGGAFYVGNTDKPLSSLNKISQKKDYIVCETSSFALESTFCFRPNISAILNLAPDHLSRHKTFENYALQKKKIFANQNENDFAVFNYDDEIVKSFSNDCNAKKFFFSTKNHELNENYCGIYVENGKIFFKEGIEKIFICQTSSIKLIGQKNLENVLAASLIAVLCGINPNEIQNAISNFLPPEHRLEVFYQNDLIRVINDSKATNVASVLADVGSLCGKTVVLCGGSDKGENFESLFSNLNNNIEMVVCFGKTREKLVESAKNVGFKKITVAFNLADATQKGLKLCKALGAGTTLVLAPACASFDEFKNFEERGNFFKNLILNGENL